MAPQAQNTLHIERWHQELAEHHMNKLQRVAQSSVVVAVILLVTGCVIEPRDSYYDREHNRYYHDHTWHDCGEHDDHCRR